jgi:hypothetical protein
MGDAIATTYLARNDWLVVWNIFLSIQLGIIIIPSDEVHHFSEG